MKTNQQEITKIAQSASIPSMQLSVYDQKNGIRSIALSGTDVECSTSQVFQAASLGKPLFSYIVMRLVDEGKMDLDAHVAEYTDIDRFVDRQMAEKITARIVLSHTSGLYNWAYSPTSAAWSDSPIGFHFPVDECYGYSGEAYAFLQRAAEAVSGKSLDELAREYVFEPFDMPLSSYGWRAEYDSLAVCGFDRDAISHGRWESIAPNCAYTLRTTSEEYMSFLVNAIVLGKGLSEEAHREWLTPRSHAIRFKGRDRDCDKDMFWCLGMGVKVGEDATPKQLWHWGDNDYWKSLYVVDIEKKVVMDYFTNSAAGHDICDAVCKSIMGESYGIQDWIGGEDDL